MKTRPLLALTTGDPGGVGPELALKICQDKEILDRCVPILYADKLTLSLVASRLGLEVPASVMTVSEWQSFEGTFEQPVVVDFAALTAEQIQPGVISGSHGNACYQYITQAIDDALAGKVAGVVTGPIQKESLREAGINYPGHTEIFAERTQTPHYRMMLTSETITCSFVTAHVGYHEVPSLLSIQRILETITTTAKALKEIRGRDVKLLCCGLNPHAGEHGLFGNREEERFIVPAIEQARALGIAVDGPLPPDTCFLPARRREYDAFICMYHDQGHIPLKALAFDEAVNITLGLPIIRTSVDHGTAFDIAWQGIANPGSMKQALILASSLSRSRA